jgi:hypothetical protein
MVDFSLLDMQSFYNLQSSMDLSLLLQYIAYGIIRYLIKRCVDVSRIPEECVDIRC